MGAPSGAWAGWKRHFLTVWTTFFTSLGLVVSSSCVSVTRPSVFTVASSLTVASFETTTNGGGQSMHAGSGRFWGMRPRPAVRRSSRVGAEFRMRWSRASVSGVSGSVRRRSSIFCGVVVGSEVDPAAVVGVTRRTRTLRSRAAAFRRRSPRIMISAPVRLARANAASFSAVLPDAPARCGHFTDFPCGGAVAGGGCRRRGRKRVRRQADGPVRLPLR